jgi:plasmid rolling circle replication initiator protein Rep
MLKINEVFEPVEVIAHFKNLKIEILRFKWNGSVYKISEMLQSWKIPNGEGFNTHYVVTCKDKDLLCELSFCNTDMKWELVRYDSIA